jgi:hypothetical protein
MLVPILLGLSIIANGQNSHFSFASINAQKTEISLENNNLELLNGDFSALEFNESIKKATDNSTLVKTGKILTFVGIPLAIIGGIMVSQADALYYNCNNGVCDGDAKGGFGIIILAAGIGLTGTGIVLWTIGSKK